jgi:hypothetical protein
MSIALEYDGWDSKPHELAPAESGLKRWVLLRYVLPCPVEVALWEFA